ncbi:MAG: fumarylacetoacetate hydrolase family protein [Bacteroidia bacterium]|nr:fumarylacetoacetate hydrolase family protein [Bacteroidia bacterium]
MSKITEVADQLWNADLEKNAIAPIREVIGATDIDSAYKIQQLNVEKRIRQGEQVVGKKIGLTSFAVQEQLGVDQPDYGMLFNTNEVKDGGTLSYAELLQPKAEAEIAFVMGEDLDGDINMSDLIGAIDYALASIEIVGSRVENWDIRITDTIADNASASHFVLGSKKVNIEELDLENCRMTMTKNKETASEGVGKACMDNPLNAALWLAQVMIKNGTPLKKGEILLSGALGPMVPIEQGDEFTAEIEGLGSVSVKID